MDRVDPNAAGDLFLLIFPENKMTATIDPNRGTGTQAQPVQFSAAEITRLLERIARGSEQEVAEAAKA